MKLLNEELGVVSYEPAIAFFQVTPKLTEIGDEANESLRIGQNLPMWMTRKISILAVSLTMMSQIEVSHFISVIKTRFTDIRNLFDQYRYSNIFQEKKLIITNIGMAISEKFMQDVAELPSDDWVSLERQTPNDTPEENRTRLLMRPDDDNW